MNPRGKYMNLRQPFTYIIFQIVLLISSPCWLFQVEQDAYYLEQFSAAVEDGFQDGLPLHIANPEESVFAIMTESEFEEKNVEEIQGIFRQRHIIVKDMRTTQYQFGEEGLYSLTGLTTVVDIQGV
jgi:hypothetical protein